MMTVRFPSGFSIQYNSANYVKRWASYSDLYTTEGGSWIAQVPNEAIVEAVIPCRTYFAQNETAMVKVDNLSHEVRLLKRQIARLAKAAEK